LAVSSNTVNEVGESILITLIAPYEKVVRVLSYTDSVIGEDAYNFFKKEFRWSIDDVTYSDYLNLTNENLYYLNLDPAKPFWIQYRYTVEALESGHELTFESISLEVLTEQGTLVVVPQYECCSGEESNLCNNLILECCGNETWNPYNIGGAISTYRFLSKTVSDIFGFCVQYYKTEADQRSKDVVLKEYTLFNVIESSEVKIMVPDNALPTREIAFSPLMMDYAMDVFEIHIVKSEFEQIFGRGSRPEQGDYLYFPIMQKLYEVNSVARPDDFMYDSSYWRVGLVTYQQRSNFTFSDQNIEDEVDALVSNLDDFEAEVVKEEKIVSKPQEYKTIGTEGNDYIRRSLLKKLIIKEEKIYNNWTVIGKYYYNLASLTTSERGIIYRYDKGIGESDNRSFTYWFRPALSKPVYPNVNITSINDNSGLAEIVVASTGYSVGDFVVIEGTADYNGLAEIVEISSSSYTIDKDYETSTINAGARLHKEEKCNFLKNTATDGTTYFSISYTKNYYVVEINAMKYVFDLTTNSAELVNNQWYAVVINFSNIFQQLSLFLWKSQRILGSSDPVRNVELDNTYSSTYQTASKISIPDGNEWGIYGCNMAFTNFRIFTQPIEIEEQSLVLSQYVVKNTDLADVVDNASPQLRLSRVTNPR
jgi:hypothetical protein